jgi:hypothetical protein
MKANVSASDSVPQEDTQNPIADMAGIKNDTQTC